MAQTIGSLDLNAFSDLYSDSTQYFWFEGNASATYGAGAHVTLVPDTSFISNPTGQNILMNTDGFSIRNGLLPMMVLDNNSLDFNIVDTTAGTYTTTATFTATGAQIGQTSGAHSVIDANGQRFYASNGATQLANIGYGAGTNAESGTTTAPYYTFGIRRESANDYSSTSTYYLGYVCVYNGKLYVCIVDEIVREPWDSTKWQLAIGNYSHAEGVSTIASGFSSHAEGENTKAIGRDSHASGYITMASGENSHAEGYDATASGGNSHAEGYNTIASGENSHAEGEGTTASEDASHAEGFGTTASGSYDHAEGLYTIASGCYSHAEGQSTTASANASHAEGYGATASGNYAHAEGYYTVASGDASHASGYQTIASGDYQTVIGRLNVSNSNYALIIGGGNVPNETRKNILTVDWNGKIQTSQMQAGNINATSVSANSYTDVSVRFSSAMSGTPIVVCSVVSTSTAGAIGSITSAVTSTSTTGFTCRIFNAGSAARTPGVNWIALNI